LCWVRGDSSDPPAFRCPAAGAGENLENAWFGDFSQLYDLRHHAVTAPAETEIGDPMIREITGHASNPTLQHYLRIAKLSSVGRSEAGTPQESLKDPFCQKGMVTSCLRNLCD
jgi:hypothetical protein